MLVLYNKESSRTNKQYEKKSNIIVQKCIDDLSEIQKISYLNDLDEENEEAREDVGGDIYNNSADKIEVQDDDEEDENNSSHENKEDEDEDGNKIYYLSIAFKLSPINIKKNLNLLLFKLLYI